MRLLPSRRRSSNRPKSAFFPKLKRWFPRLETLEDRRLFAVMASGAAGWESSYLASSPPMGLKQAAVIRPVTAAALVDDSLENNDTFSTATNLGTLSSSLAISGLVMGDANDFYRFALTSTGQSTDSASISFQHALGDLDLALYDAGGRLLRYSNGVSNGEAISLSGLTAGTYYLRAYGYRGVTNPSYSLNVRVAQSVVDDAYENNDSFAAARDLGTLTSVTTVSSLVLADSQDWYRFSMSGAGGSSDYAGINFANAQGNLGLSLYSGTGTLLAASNGSTDSERISLAGRAAGTYYVLVSGATNPSYSLSIDPGVVVSPPTTPPPTTTSAFNIDFTFSGLTASQQAIFEQAAGKWESIIIGDLPNTTYNGRAVDDLLISAAATAIDGRGGVLGQAGPDRFRSGSQLPYHGAMEFDSADLASMEANGTLLGVIEHEMGHVLGIGTLWQSKGLLSGAGTSNPRFTGTRAVAAYNSIFGVNSTGVPLETGGGAGTRDSHWSESLFSTEIMTGYVGPGSNMPISRITVGSLADIGYTVNYAAADPYARPGGTSASLVTSSSTASSRSSILASSSVIVLPTAGSAAVNALVIPRSTEGGRLDAPSTRSGAISDRMEVAAAAIDLLARHRSMPATAVDELFADPALWLLSA
jgi:hypothetical protein